LVAVSVEVVVHPAIAAAEDRIRKARRFIFDCSWGCTFPLP
jgi:hypothetical protein